MPLIWWISIPLGYFSEHYFAWIEKGKSHSFIAHATYILLSALSVIILRDSVALSDIQPFYTFISIFVGIILIVTTTLFFALSYLTEQSRKRMEATPEWKKPPKWRKKRYYQAPMPFFIKFPLFVLIALFLFYLAMPGEKFFTPVFKVKSGNGEKTILERISSPPTLQPGGDRFKK